MRSAAHGGWSGGSSFRRYCEVCLGRLLVRSEPPVDELALDCIASRLEFFARSALLSGDTGSRCAFGGNQQQRVQKVK